MTNEVTIEGNNIVINKENENTKTMEIPLEDTNSLLGFIKLLKDKGVVDTDIERIKPFITNMFKNPYIEATTELYDYCKALDFEITDDGCFLAYKNVNKDLSSIYDNGKTKHTIGEYTEVKKFDTNRRTECSSGLHFCSKSYLKSYSGDTTIIVKINPEDVVSIPTDYNFTKGRCRKYLTVGIIGKDGDLHTTNIEAVSEGTVKVVKTKERTKIDKNTAVTKAKEANGGRIKETASLMKVHKDDVAKVATIMNISVETVRRNIRKYKQVHK